MTCPSCGEKPKCNCTRDFPKSVIEINNPETLVLLRKVVIPASMGDDTTVSPAIGKYHNVILYYESNRHTYIYSSDGIPTLLETEVPQEVWDRIEALEDDFNSLATVARTGSYNDLTDKPTIGDGTLTIKRNGTSVGTFGANDTANTDIDISVPTTPSDIGAQPLIDATHKIDADFVDDSTSTNKFVTASQKSAIDTALQPASIDKVVMTDFSIGANSSTTTVQLDGAKENLLTGATSTKTISMPVASSSEAGVMNSSTYDAVTNNTSNINALLNGSVAITGLSANPSQSDLTTAWQTETGLSTLINRAGIYDVSNNKVWTYYTNDTTWHAASNTTQVTINTFTNSAEGTIKGSTNVGQVFAENDGTGSVNGWDNLSSAVSDNTSNISSLQNTKQDKLIAGSNITIAGDGKTISATDTTYTAGTGLDLNGTEFSVDTNEIQEKLTAGDAITIDGNTISADILPADYFTAGETVTDTGTEITLNNTISSRLSDIKLYGDTTQETTTGKNLFNKDATPSGYGGSSTTVTALATGVKVTLAGGTGYGFAGWIIGKLSDYVGKTITLSANVVSSGTHNPRMNIGICNDTFGDRTTKESTTGTGEQSISWVVEDDPTSQYLQVSIYAASSGGAIGDYCEYSDLQLEIGSTATSYEPYTGGIPAPNPDYPETINVVTGVQTVTVSNEQNLLDISSTVSGSINASTGEIVANTANMCGSNYISVTPNTTYTLSANTVFTDLRVNTYTSNKTNIARVSNSGASSFTFTTGNNTYYVRWSANYNGQAINDPIATATSTQLWLNEGSQRAIFSNFTIDLGATELCKIGTHQDKIYKSGGDWYVHKEVDSVLLDTLASNFIFGSRNDSYSLQKNTYLPQFSLPSSTTNVYVTTFKPVNSASLIKVGSIYFTGSYLHLDYDGTSTSAGLATFQSWLSTSNTRLYAVLATPTDTKITDATLISELEALWNANSYNDTTCLTVTATGTNLPALLEATAYRKSLSGTIGAINDITNNIMQTLPIASASQLGGVKVGSRLSIDSSGVLSADLQAETITSNEWNNLWI